MKKKAIRKIISLAVAVLIVCSLSVCALATVRTIAVTVKAGQNLEGICKEHGLDLGKNKKLIMELNGFANPGEMNRILAGSTIILPAPENEEVRSSGPVTIVAGDAAKAVAGDRIAYYVVLYTIQSGDILTNLYRQWGMELGNYQSRIMSLNGLNNLDRLVVGKMMYLPVNRGDIAGMANYTVLAHTIGRNEFVYDICRNYGLDFDSARVSLQYFNPGMSFANVNAGDVIYIPVTGRAAPTTAVSAAGTTPAFNAGMMPAAVTEITSNSAVTSVPAEPGTTPALGPLSGNSVLPVEWVYDGFAVVVGCDGCLTLRLPDSGEDINVAYTPQSLMNYSPTPGDYVHAIFTPTDYLLVSIQYVYNVFTGA